MFEPSSAEFPSPEANPGRAQELARAFELFNRTSAQLAGSYRALEQRVAELSAELAAVRDERLRQLAEKESIANRLQHLLEVLPGGLVVVDGAGTVVEGNPAAVALLGEALVGRCWQEVVATAVSPEASNAGELTLRSGRRISVSRRPLDPEPGQIVLLLDVTDQHLLREMLSRHQRLSLMGEMVASLAHQLRTPLSSALLYSSQLVLPDIAPEARARFVERIVGRLRHLEGMVNEMLQFAHGGGFDTDDVAVQYVVDDLLNTLEPQLQRAGADLQVHNRIPGASLRGSREALHSALLNLATNALQACTHSPRLRLEIDRDGPAFIELMLSDNGPGIPESLREKVFTPFFTTRADGTGLGLPVVRAIVLAHGGDLWMRSSAAGTTVGLRIPTGAATPLASCAAAAGMTAWRSHTSTAQWPLAAAVRTPDWHGNNHAQSVQNRRNTP
ncbi:MAG: ATP-binding protein [Porticoccaceae bacterium]